MQSTIKVSAAQLRSLEGPFLQWKAGSPDAFAIGVGTPESLSSPQLAFVSDLHFLSEALQKASLLVVENKILAQVTDLSAHQAVFGTPSLKAAMVLILPLFDPRQLVTEPAISPQAFVHSTAKIGQGVRIFPGASIGAHVQIGDHTEIRSGTVIESFCQIGSRCLIQANVTIGSDGFGFATDPQGSHHKVPQIGRVVIEDDVEIGSNTTVDRATLGETRIGQGSKFDKHCHIGHNCRIGKHGIFAGGFMVAGSAIIGDYCLSGGSVVVSDHVTICDRVILGGRSAVTKDITQPGAYAGYPLQPLKDSLRTTQNMTHLTDMRQQLKAISKKLGFNPDSE